MLFGKITEHEHAHPRTSDLEALGYMHGYYTSQERHKSQANTYSTEKDLPW